ncbi:MAG: hypothetical protein HOO86_15780 [Bacteroidales bacterium]|nr:hypothetical protein [Bacteroidales bacterium]
MWTVIFILIGIGLIVVLLEILVIPGGGLAGVLGFAMMAIGVFLTYSREGTTAGHLVLAGTLVVNIGTLILALRSKTWDRAMLKTNIEGRVNTIEDNELNVGDIGKTISRCAPMGKALINDRFYEVTSYSEFIDEETEIEVIKIEKSKIFIKLKS